MFAVLSTPHVKRLLATSLLGRLPMTAIGLLLILRVRDLDGSYALGGLAAGAYALSSAVTNPAIGRMIDRRGQARVLGACAGVAASAYFVLALLPGSAPASLVVVFGAMIGAANPPLSASLRTVWSDVLPDADDLHRMMSLESAIQEVIFIVGPIVLVTGLAAVSIQLALLAGGAILLGGTLLFVAHPASRARRGDASVSQGNLLGPLGMPEVRVLILVLLAMGTSFGAIEITCAAFSEAAGHRGAIGLLLGVWGLGSVCGGLLAARGGIPPSRVSRLRAILVGLALATLVPTLAVAGDVVAPTTPGLIVLSLLLFGAGLAIAPTFPLVFGLMGDVAPTSMATEAFTWLGAGITSGIALGSALGGAAIGIADSSAGALVVAAVAALLAATAMRGYRDAAPAALAVS